MSQGPEVRVLLVSAEREDHEYLTDLIHDETCSLQPDSRWTLHCSDSIVSALTVLENYQIPIVLSGCKVGSDTWRTMVDALASYPRPPLLIVISRLDDERLWAEALNLGVYDLLAKPLATSEVVRILNQAWRQWQAIREGSRGRNSLYKTAEVA